MIWWDCSLSDFARPRKSVVNSHLSECHLGLTLKLFVSVAGLAAAPLWGPQLNYNAAIVPSIDVSIVTSDVQFRTETRLLPAYSRAERLGTLPLQQLARLGFSHFQTHDCQARAFDGTG